MPLSLAPSPTIVTIPEDQEERSGKGTDVEELGQQFGALLAGPLLR